MIAIRVAVGTARSALRLGASAAAGLVLAGCASAPLKTSLLASPVKIDAARAQSMISTYRREHGLSALALDPALDAAAQAQAMAMASSNSLSHSVAGSLSDRLDAAHIRNSAAAENVSGGYSTLADAIDGWRRSPAHNANLLDPYVRRMGIASAAAPGSKYHVYWALDLTD